MADLVKLSDAAKHCGLPPRILKLLIADGLLPQAQRTTNGHMQLPDDDLPTWQQCRDLIEQRRAHHLAQAGKLLDRIAIEIDAVRNDLAEAREHPTQQLGVDLIAASSYSRTQQTTLAAALHQFDYVQMDIIRYHSALLDIVAIDKA